MALSLLSIAKTYALTVALGVTAAALVAVIAAFVIILAKLDKKQTHLTKTEVYHHVLRPKPQLKQKIEGKASPKKDRKGQDKNSVDEVKKPKRGKKKKKPKYVFVTDAQGAGAAGDDVSEAESKAEESIEE